MPVIDIHPHIVSPDIRRYPLAPLGGTQSTWSSERPTSYEMLLKEMNAAGVDRAAIVHSSTAYGYDNSYVADAVAAVPSRFTGVYSIDVLAPDAIKTFDYWLGCSRPAARSRISRRGLPIRGHIRSGNMRRPRTFRSACR
jgi:L-fuconolactonase